MRQAFHIFRKDTRRLLPLIGLHLLVLCLHVWLWIVPPLASAHEMLRSGPKTAVSVLLPFLWALLAASAVHNDALVGTRQFWLTRPYPRASLAGAKLLFLFCWITLPAAVSDLAICGARGLLPTLTAGSLLWRHFYFAAILALPAAALASVTRTLTQSFLAVAAGLAALAMLLSASEHGSFLLWANQGAARYTPFEWTVTASGVLLAAAFSLGILFLQCFRRATARARLLGAAGLVLLTGVYYLRADWSYSLQVLASRTPEARAPEVTLDAERDALEYWRGLSVYYTSPSLIQAAVPVKVEGLTDGTAINLIVTRSRLEWRQDGQVRTLPFPSTPTLNTSRDGNRTWLNLSISEIPLPLRSQSVTLAGTAYAAYYDKRGGMRLPWRPGFVRLPDGWPCYTHHNPMHANVTVSCYAAASAPPVQGYEIEDRISGQRIPGWGRESGWGLSPLPTTSITPIVTFGPRFELYRRRGTITTTFDAAQLATSEIVIHAGAPRAVARFELRIDGIQLDRYDMGTARRMGVGIPVQ